VGVAPEKLIRRHPGEHGVGLLGPDQPDRPVEIGRVDERAGALDEDRGRRLDVVAAHHVEGVQQRRLRARPVAGELA
jgi:hypothetical protein